MPGYYVDSQEPITTGESEPEPDVFVARGRAEEYAAHPLAEDTLLVVEIADQTLRRDRNWKKLIYARAGIPAYWIVNLVNRQVEVYTQPSGAAAAADYKQTQIVPLDGVLPVMIDGREVGRILVKDILP